MNLPYFNAGGAAIGCGITGFSEFPDAASLVAFLDYLGIERSLVWHKEALDINATIGNGKLLKSLAATEESRRRLVPAFIVSPTLMFEREGLAFLLHAMQEDGVRALRILPSSGRFSIGTLERLLREVQSFKPVIFWNIGDSNGRSDIVEFTELALKFPELTFVVSEFMWGHLNNVLDMMWRARNICAEISWHHITQGLEVLARQFGPERVLFGIGPKSHYGAAVTAVAYADLDETAKRRIAGDNLRELLGLAPFSGTLHPPVILGQKPLWTSFREGRGVPGLQIIDAHGHSGPGGARCWNFIDTSSDPAVYVRRITDSLDQTGIEHIIVSHMPALFGDAVAGNRDIEAACAAHANGRISGYVAFNPFYKDALLPELDGYFSRGFFKGFKLLPDYWRVPVTDERFVPVWEYANRYRLPILVHTWEGPNNSPALLTDIVRKYPEAVFLLGHSGGGTAGRAEALKLAVNNPNVFLEFCGSFTTPVDYVEAIQQLGIGRIIFGSDMDGHSHAWELGRFLSLPLPDDQLRPALADNIQRILANVIPVKPHQS